MERIIVFVNHAPLKALDAEAKREGIRRSALLRKAAEAYLQEARRQREEGDERRRRMEEASTGIDRLAEKLGDWDPVRIIREFRDARPRSRQ